MKRITLALGSVVFALFSYSQAFAGTPTALVAKPIVTVDKPVCVVPIPGDNNRLFIIEYQTGNIKILNLTNNTISGTFLNVSPISTATNEQGLLGLAFHPNYQTNGYFYVFYTAPSPDRNELARYKVLGDPATSNVADPNSKTILLSFNDPFTNHNGGWLAFGPDGYLYISTGDSGDAGNNYSLNTNSLFGKLLRIDVNSGNPYGIPPTNPFVGVPNTRPEIWAYGLRNPWRCSFDRATGDIWIGDVGEKYEEINILPANPGSVRNFGYRARDGFIKNPDWPSDPDVPAASRRDPVYAYEASARAIIGGYRYRGTALPGMQGKYFFADVYNPDHQICSADYDGTQLVNIFNHKPEMSSVWFGGIVSFGEDNNGELYFCTFGGTATIFRIEAAVPSASFAVGSSNGSEASTPAGLVVNLSRAPSANATINYAVTGTASGGGVDYTLANGSLTFTPSGPLSQTISIPIVNDTLDEDNETIIVTLTGATNASLGSTKVHTYTINDDDAPPNIAFSTATSSGSESVTASNLAVSLSAPSGKAVTINYMVTGGTAANGGVDYTLNPGTLTFSPGQTSRNIAVAVVNDSVSEPNETINVTLGTPINCTLVSPSTHVYTINNDDTVPSISFAAASSNGSEAATPANLIVAISSAPSANATVNYAVTGGSATGGGTDYTLASGTLTFTPTGPVSQNIALAIVNDTLAEAAETIVVTLSSPANATLGTITAHTFTINDNDSQPSVAFASVSSSGNEATTSVNLAVNLSAASSQTVNVNYAASGGTATGGGVDYTLTSGTLTFAAGQTSASIAVTIVNDVVQEPNETIVVTLSSPTNATLGANSSHTYTVNNDDIAPVFASTPVTAGNIGVAYTYDADATGTPTPGYSLISFPAGMTINSTSGVVSWTPSASGSFGVTIRATNAAGTADQTFTIVVANYGLNSRLPVTPFLSMPGHVTEPLPAQLSGTGVFSDVSTLSVNANIIPFGVNSPLWSDNAVKSRWIALPNDGAPYTASETIAYAATGEWTFPAGTVFVKHFELNIDERDPSIKKRLETRLLVVETGGSVYGVTYKWNAAGTNADLLTTSQSENITITTSTGGTRTQSWYYPSRSDCLTCHTPTAGYVLGVKTRQLNGNFSYPSTGVTDNQLRTWNRISMFNTTLNESTIPSLAKLVRVDDPNATLENRVRSYMDSNCAQCHRPTGTPASFDARYDTPYASQNILEGTVNSTLGITNPKVLARGSMARSMAHHRMNLLGANQMPPLARNVSDTAALNTIRDYVQSMAAAPSNLSATAVSSNQINLAWTDNGDSENSFRVECSPDGTTGWTEVGFTAANVTTFSHSGLSAATTYHYRIRAVVPSTDSAISNLASATTNASTPPPAFSAKINFQPASATPVPGYLIDAGAVFANRGNGFDYGWNLDHAAHTRDRNSPSAPDQRYDTMVLMQRASPTAFWEIAVPNGTYSVKAVCGDPAYTDVLYRLNVEGVQTVNGTSTASAKWVEGTQIVNVSDGRLTVTSGTGATANAICFIEITASVPNTAPAIASAANAVPNPALVNQAVSFSVGANDPDGDSLSYAWNFGDGTTGSGASVSHTYASAGTYLATVSVSDGRGGSASSSVNVSINPNTPPPGVDIKINFQPATAAIPAGYLPDFGNVFGDRGNGQTYGWNMNLTSETRDRNAPSSPDQRYDTLLHMQRISQTTFWEIALPNGSYSVRIICGDPSYTGVVHRVNAEGVLTVSGTSTATVKWFECTQTVIVSDGRLTISNGAGATDNKINFVEITSAGAESAAASALLAFSTSDVVAETLTVRKLKTSLNLSQQGRDACSVAGTLPALPADFKPAGVAGSIDVGAAIQSFVLDPKGRTRNANGTISIKFNKTRGWTFTASLKRGTWNEAWADSGLSNTTVRNTPVELAVTLALGDRIFSGTKIVKYTAKEMKTGKAQ